MPELVSYRKFRPQKFSEVLNQEHVKVTLANAVMNGRIGHAYLFTGPRGVGKTTLARIFARAVNCPSAKDGEPCNECGVCREFLGNNSLDLLEIDAASHTGVDNIRELIDHLQFAPTRAKYKVIIVDEVHMLSKGAFNALLKTLEEPPSHAIFILATTEIHKVPATIISRTQKFDFKRIAVADLVSMLKLVAASNNVQASDEALLNIAHAADGGGRDGLSLLDQVMGFASGDITVELTEQVLGLTGMRTTGKFLDLLLAGQAKAAIDFIANLSYQGRDLHQFQKDLLEYLRKVMLVKIGNSPDNEFTADVKEVMVRQATALPLPALAKLLSLFQKAGEEMKYSSIPGLPLELASLDALEICSGQSQSPGPVPAAAAASASAPDSSGDIAEITKAWPQILAKIKTYNHSLLSSLKLAIPAAIEGKHVVVAFPYKFHKDAIEAPKNRIVVDQVLDEVIGRKLLIKPILRKDWPGELPEIGEEAPSASAQENSPEPEPSINADDSINSALRIMGGEMDKAG